VVKDQMVTDRFAVYCGDCYEVAKVLPSDSVHFGISSWPFESLYTYSNSERDIGNCRTPEEFRQHMRFIVAEQFRVMIPGRLVAIHCMNLPTTKARDGYIGLRDFRGDIIRLMQDAGFIYHSEVCIWKDPVTAMQRTKALGLLHKQIKKDSSMSRQGIPDYLVVFRKPGVNPEPVTHTNESFPVQMWQRYASPVWALVGEDYGDGILNCYQDINPSDTLQKESARDHKDERHICPLQKEVIRRAIALWTNPGDIVWDQFGGIGTSGTEALQMNRRAIMSELKDSYYRQNVLNCQAATHHAGDMPLFAGL
jgi:DNA modification methylase